MSASQANRRRLVIVAGLALIAVITATAVSAYYAYEAYQTYLVSRGGMSPEPPPIELIQAGPSSPLSIPAGYHAERVATAPLVQYPMFACFDDEGRLYVAGSSGHHLDAKGLSEALPDVIRRLEDTDGDGHFDKSTVFADKLTFPQGVLWHDGAVYTASPPSLWRLKDADGDGVADEREELVTGFPFTGIADDLHGPCLGPDGRIYWGVGRFPYEIRRPGGPVIRKGMSPLIMRCKPDGSEIEVVCAALGNPVEVAFSVEGEPFVCGTFLAPDSMGIGLRDGIIHCVEGGVYPIRDRDLHEDKWTGDPLPAMVQLGVAAGSGIMRSRRFVRSDTPVLFSALFNMHKVQRHVLKRAGSTFVSQNEDFLTSKDPDFHPTDVLEDADGSMLVLDTGAWFESCPTSQIEHERVRGGIYRIRRTRAPHVKDPWGVALNWEKIRPREYVDYLDDPRFPVRDRAIREIARAGVAMVPNIQELLRRSRSELARRNAVWALARIDAPIAREAVVQALSDRSRVVRQIAAYSVGLHRDARGLARLLEMVRSDAPQIRREAATALGRVGQGAAVPVLLAGLRQSADRFLDHALIYALIELDDPKRTRESLRDPSPDVRRGALIALDQMKHGVLEPNDVVPLLDAPEPALQQAASRVLASRPEWAKAMVGPLRQWLIRKPVDDSRQKSLRHELVALAKTAPVEELIGSVLRDPKTPVWSRTLMLEVIGESAVSPMPASWVAAIRDRLSDDDESVVRQAVSAVRSTGLVVVDPELLELARGSSHSLDVHIEAIEAIAPRLPRLDAALFALLLEALDSDQPALGRLTAARVLGQSPLDDDQLLKLAGAVGKAGALILPRLIPVYARSHSANVGAALVAALERSPSLRSLTPEALGASLKNFPESIQARARPLFQKLDVGTREKAKFLAEMLPLLRRGDADRGRTVFFGPRATCSTCHTVRSQGGHVGPDLSKIGTIRTERDLLEAILFPSATFARGFEPFTVATNDGRVLSGIIARETSDAVCLRSADRRETIVPRSSIEAIEPSPESIMPRGLEANISRPELADLVLFLKSLN